MLRKAKSKKKEEKLPKTAGIIYSEVKRTYFPTHAQFYTEKYALDNARIVATYMGKLGIKPKLYPATAILPERLRKDQPEVVLNLAGSVRGNEYLAAAIPAVLELLEIPYTGADMLGESLSYNKFLTKKLLEQNGVPVPRYQLLNTPTDTLDSSLRFPLISKLNEIHGAVEITSDAVSENEKHLRQRLKQMIKTYVQPILVEEFIVGREITCFLLEGLNKKVYLAEQLVRDADKKYAFATFEQQWINYSDDTIQFQKYKDSLLNEYVKRAFDVTRMSDYGKFDVRIDNSGRYFFIDANSNPYFGPKDIAAPIAYILDLYGVSFTEILKRLLLNALREAKGKKLLPFGDS